MRDKNRLISVSPLVIILTSVSMMPSVIVCMIAETRNQTAEAKDCFSESWLREFAYVKGDVTRVIIGVDRAKSNVWEKLKQLAVWHGAKIVDTLSIGNEVNALIVETPLKMAATFATNIANTEYASYVQPCIKYKAAFEPNDPLYSTDQWAPQKIMANWAWNITMGDPQRVLVAIVDTGIAYNHPDLAANYVPLGYNWVDNNASPIDDFFHGTHCAGIVAAVTNNSIGVSGLAQVRIMAEKGLNSSGEGYSDWLYNSIMHAANQGANIISMSWGSPVHDSLIYQAIQYAYYNKSALLIAAAGNHNSILKSYPAAYKEVIAVSATDRFDNRWNCSNFGKWVELAAPGAEIWSTFVDWFYYGGQPEYTYGPLSGTSMAGPHVAGVAALIWSRYPNMTRDSVRHWLKYVTDDLGELGFDRFYGYGRINAYKAVNTTQPDYDLVALELQVPQVVKAGSCVNLKGIVLNFGEENVTNVNVTLYRNDTEINHRMVNLISGNSTEIDFQWISVAGTYNLTFRISYSDDCRLQNNIVSKIVTARSPTTLNVTSGQSIQEAADSAIAGDTINVSAGTFYERIFVDVDNVKLVGKSMEDTVVDSSESGCVVSIQADNINITGIRAVNSDHAYSLFDGGVGIFDSRNVTVENCNLTGNVIGVVVSCSQDVSIYRNHVTLNTYYWGYGVYLYNSTSVTAWFNQITGNTRGFCLFISSGNYIEGNNITTSVYGILLDRSSGNMICHNNFIDNTCQVYDIDPYNTTINAWDGDYPSGGNYWSNYGGSDTKWGPNQDQTGSDGMGDTPYFINTNNQDHYPLIEPWRPGQHDLAVTGLSPSKTTVAPSETIQMTTTVKNIGNFTEVFHLKIYWSGGTIRNETDITLSPGTTITRVDTWTAPSTPGDYTITAEASNVAGETNTANNKRTITITVSSGGGGGGGGEPPLNQGKP